MDCAAETEIIRLLPELRNSHRLGLSLHLTVVTLCGISSDNLLEISS